MMHTADSSSALSLMAGRMQFGYGSLGFTTLGMCTPTKSAASDITTSGRHIHTSAEAVKAGRLIVVKALA
jgi:hypothetical protein